MKELAAFRNQKQKIRLQLLEMHLELLSGFLFACLFSSHVFRNVVLQFLSIG